jgi:L-lactate dehydrogenase (cytochrome)
MRDKAFIERLIDRAKAAKCPVLVLTMDLQILGQRHKDIRNGLKAPPPITPKFLFEIATKPAWAFGMLGTQRRTFRNIYGHVSQATNLKSLSMWTRTQFDLTLNWKDIGWIKDRFGGPVVVKGVLDSEDARLAVDNGADAIIVSNHGGRQLDSAPSSISVLPDIAGAVNGQIEVFFDGGIRTGGDIVKALGRGARSCLSGRACRYGLAANGRDGVLCALRLFEQELKDCIALLGVADVRHIDRSMVTPQPPL